MKQETLRKAVLGNSKDPWKFLLQAGGEVSRDATTCPAPNANLERVFCPSETTEELTEEQADFLLRSDSWNVTDYCRVGAAIGKRIPSSRLYRLLKRVADSVRESDYRLKANDVAALCGNAGRFILPFVPVDYIRQSFHSSFMVSKMDPEFGARLAVFTFENDSSASVRKNAFAALRRFAPEKARELIRRVWNDESEPTFKKSDFRQALLSALSFSLSSDDVPFLEEVATGKGPALVRIAIRELATIPESRFYRIVRERADEIVGLDGTIAIPEYSKELKNEGLPKFEGPILATRIIERVPLDHWTERFGVGPKGIAAIFPFSEKTFCLYAGLAIAFVHFGGDVEWFDALEPILLYETPDESDKEIEDYLYGWSSEPYQICFAHILSMVCDRFNPELADRCELRIAERRSKTPDELEYKKFLIKWERASYPPTRELVEESARFAFRKTRYFSVLKENLIDCDVERRLIRDMERFAPKDRRFVMEKIRNERRSGVLLEGNLKRAETIDARMDEGERLFRDFHRFFKLRFPSRGIDFPMAWLPSEKLNE